ncbi:MAG: HAMP domain-containing histidine kinase [Bdellovibrionales bacterium]|nr:HAMP domain-containing histidine kinase [Bdellovibrionales bacterium]
MPLKTKQKEKSISEVLSFPNRIQNTLIFYYLFPVLLLFVFLSFFFYISTKNSLDEEFGKRLKVVSQICVNQIKPIQLVSLQTTGIHGNTYKLLKDRFQTILKENQIDRVYILDSQHTIIFDSKSDISVGNPFERFHLHELEIKNTMLGDVTSSTLFKGSDGEFYKTSFSPIIDQANQTVALVGVDGSATFFDNLRKLEKRLLITGVIFILIILVISYLLSRKIVTPIELLALAAKRIGDGQIEKEISITSKNEVGFLSYVMDEMRKKIVERDESLQVMLRGIAHEIRNPLGGIELFSGILKEKISDEDAQKSIDRIIQETNNLKKLVDEFLHFAKNPVIQLKKTDLDEFFDDVHFHWKKRLLEENIEWDVHLDGKQSIEWDVDQMKRVFHNIIENSIQAMDKEIKRIHIEISSEKNHTLFRVQDNGCGISTQNQEKLFKPFFTTKTFGNGLGLAMVQKIIQAHGGDTEIRSEEKVGTTIIMILPNQQG